MEKRCSEVAIRGGRVKDSAEYWTIRKFRKKTLLYLNILLEYVSNLNTVTDSYSIVAEKFKKQSLVLRTNI